MVSNRSEAKAALGGGDLQRVGSWEQAGPTSLRSARKEGCATRGSLLPMGTEGLGGLGRASQRGEAGGDWESARGDAKVKKKSPGGEESGGGEMWRGCGVEASVEDAGVHCGEPIRK